MNNRMYCSGKYHIYTGIFASQGCRYGDSNFWVEEKRAHQMLADSGIQLMSMPLERDICGVHSPGWLATGIESNQLEQWLPPEVQYACLYWFQHLQKSWVSLDDDSYHVYAFLQGHLLQRLEALSLMGKTSEGVLMLSSKADKIPNLHVFVHDAKRFVLYNRAVIELAPLQAYCLALIFAPEQSIIRRQFKNHIPSWICKKPRVQAKWNATWL